MAAERKPPFDPKFPGDRATAPAALEETSDSAWQRFVSLQEGGDFERTREQTLPPGFAPTEVQPHPGTGTISGEAAPRRGPLTLDDVMLLARRNNRACPLPPQWLAFHLLLPTPTVGKHVLHAPPPLDGPDWAASSPLSKRLRLRDQIEWADRHGALQAAHDFLAALPEDQWYHLSR